MGLPGRCHGRVLHRVGHQGWRCRGVVGVLGWVPLFSLQVLFVGKVAAVVGGHAGCWVLPAVTAGEVPAAAWRTLSIPQVSALVRGLAALGVSLSLYCFLAALKRCKM